MENALQSVLLSGYLETTVIFLKARKKYYPNRVTLHPILLLSPMQQIILTLIIWSGFVQYASIAVADSQPPISSTELEQQIHRQINRERQKYGRPALDSDQQLVAIARNHSRDMAGRHFFSHINLQGEGPTDRAKHKGWNKRKQVNPGTVATGVAENIYLTHLYDKVYSTVQNGITVEKEYAWTSRNRIVESIVQGWLQSEHHQKIMLSPQYERHGVGVAISGYDVYVTENLF